MRAAEFSNFASMFLLLIVLGVPMLSQVQADLCDCIDTVYGPGYIPSLGPIPATSYPLHNASAQYDIDAVEQALATGADVNGLWNGYTPLHVALLATNPAGTLTDTYVEGTYRTVYYLLDRGANPDIPFPLDYSPRQSSALFWPAYDGHWAMVRRMIQAGADINYRNANGSTPLHQAAKCDFRLSYDPRAASTAEVLLAYGAQLDVKDSDGNTPLDVTPDGPSCDGPDYADASNCPMTCAVLKNGVNSTRVDAIKSGAVLVNGLEPTIIKKCCDDPLNNTDPRYINSSQCCVS